MEEENTAMRQVRVEPHFLQSRWICQSGNGTTPKAPKRYEDPAFFSLQQHGMAKRTSGRSGKNRNFFNFDLASASISNQRFSLVWSLYESESAWTAFAGSNDDRFESSVN